MQRETMPKLTKKEVIEICNQEALKQNDWGPLKGKIRIGFGLEKNRIVWNLRDNADFRGGQKFQGR